jgi:hypothetical protein
MNLSRVLHPDDYKLFTEHLAIDEVRNILKKNYRYEHEHRKWEYGLTLKSLLLHNEKHWGNQRVKTVLDVGGGGSVLAPLLAYYGFNVTTLDPGYGEDEVKYQNQFSAYFKHKIKFIYGDFSKDLDLELYDAVVSISTIEHVPDHQVFFNNLLRYSRRMVFLTMDWHPSGEQFSPAHLRTYNISTLLKLLDNAKMECILPYSYRFPGDYEYGGNFVYDYTFASLYIEKESLITTGGY